MTWWSLTTWARAPVRRLQRARRPGRAPGAGSRRIGRRGTARPGRHGAAPAGHGRSAGPISRADQPGRSAGPISRADQPGGNGVEHLAQGEAARGGDANRGLVEVAAASGWQGSQLRRLDAQGLASPRVVATNDLRDAGPPVVADRRQWSKVSKSRAPRSWRAWSSRVFRCPCRLSIEPFSWAIPRLLRVGSIASSAQRAS